ncbi:AI-2E family transporter [Pseudomonas sp. N040]|uniref:AI-2E family transporter n=1 Tax=Pseudomonas sp. N040 TaxID=2785325 RepID=UPI0018A28919|nr:AI-2E family transporter [Pseudomonas sp. N040]MBF7729773.1 AI-2E family transporter [Pseudomonas sp. N040]MBW7013415.1 AI-2E family transporter [Pseudomonas sp. N040]
MPAGTTEQTKLARGLLDVLIRAGLIAALVMYSYKVFQPFMGLMLWSVILAITLYPLHCMLKSRLGNRDGRAATLIVVVAIGILLIPVYLLGNSLTASVQTVMQLVKDGGLHIPPPADSIAQWPIIGAKLHAFWLEAATNLMSVAQKLAPYMKDISLTLLGQIAGAGVGLLVFIGALIIGGIIMAFGENGERSAIKIASRISGQEKGKAIAHLCTATIRAVAQGVVGIAFIQMFLIGLGFAVYGIEGAGLLAMAVLILGIMQLPATLITLPVIAYVLGTEGVSAASISFVIYTFVAGMADNVLKPLLLGRGVEVPMPVILIGALGGMVTGGIIGLFIGPVILAVAYQLFWQWVEDQPESAETSSEDQA